MKESIQALLVGPIEQSRELVRRLIAETPGVVLKEACDEYESAARKVAATRPDVAIIDLDADPVQAVDVIKTISQQCPNVAVLPASRVRDSSIILQVVRAGAREFLTLPGKPEEFQVMLGRLLSRRGQDAEGPPHPRRQGPRVISITGAAGGVGCTTLAVNVAATLAKGSPDEVVLADFDLILGSVDASLDINSDQTVEGLVQNLGRLDLTLLKRSMTRHRSGLYVLPHPMSMEDAFKIDPEALRQVLEMLKGAFPTVIVDTSKGLQPADSVAFEMSDIIVVVIQLDLNCLRNTARLLDLFRQYEGYTERVRLVLNRAGTYEKEISLKKAEETLKLPVSWQMPNVTKAVREARARGTPIEDVAPGSKIHQSILEIARGLRPAQEPDPAKPKRGLFAAFF